MASSKLFERFENLVRKLVRVYLMKHPFMEHQKEDLIQQGYLGLLIAAENFDRHRHAKFVTYAYRCIYGSLLNYGRNEIKESKKYLELMNQYSLSETPTTQSPENMLIDKTVVDDIFKEIDKISVKYFKLYHVSRMSLREIRECTGTVHCQETIRKKILLVKEKLENDLKLELKSIRIK